MSCTPTPNGFADHYPILSLLNGYFIGGIPDFQTYPVGFASAMKLENHETWSTGEVFFLQFELFCTVLSIGF